MKKLISTALAMVLFMLCCAGTLAAKEADTLAITSETEDVIYYDDGSYCIITLTQSSARTTVATSGSKTASYYTSSGVLICTLTVSGNFQYDGLTSSCTSVSHTLTVSHSSWSTSSQSSYINGCYAVANATVYRRVLGVTVETRDLNVQLCCDKYGKLS